VAAALVLQLDGELIVADLVAQGLARVGVGEDRPAAGFGLGQHEADSALALFPPDQARVEVLEAHDRLLAVQLDHHDLVEGQLVLLEEAEGAHHGVGHRGRPALFHPGLAVAALPGALEPGEIVDGAGERRGAEYERW